MDISFRGIRSLDKFESTTVSSLVGKYADRIETLTKGKKLITHVKKYDTTGTRSKYAINVRLESPSVFITAKASDWDLRRTLHKVLKKIENEAQHKFKTEGHTKRRPRNLIKPRK